MNQRVGADQIAHIYGSERADGTGANSKRCTAT